VSIVANASDREQWYIPPQAQFERYQKGGHGDTLAAQPYTTIRVLAKRGFGPYSIRFDDLSQAASYIRNTEPKDTTVIPPPAIYDFFPGFTPGDTLSWDFASGYSSIAGPGYLVKGTMRWTVTDTSSGPAGKTTDIMQRLTAQWTRWTYSAPETTWISSDTTYVAIVEDVVHRVTIQIPLNWQGSSYSWQGSLQRWQLSMQRYSIMKSGDSLVTYAGTALYGANVYARKGYGIYRFSYSDSYLSHTTTDMVRR
jgi:hypothetical protein